MATIEELEKRIALALQRLGHWDAQLVVRKIKPDAPSRRRLAAIKQALTGSK
jgi:hypothetical protein